MQLTFANRSVFRHSKSKTFFFLFGIFLSAQYSSASTEGIEFFEKKIRPLLVERCYLCHGDKLQQGKLALNSREGILNGGESGAAVVPGDVDKSLLIEAVLYENNDLKMPPNGKLPDDEIANLIDWVKAGAPMPDAGETVKTDGDTGEDHWSFQPLNESKIPNVKSNGWVESPVDAFLLAKMEEQGIEPAPPADKQTWLRRVTYDLTGLPPTPDEIQSFLSDKSEQAYEKVVNRLLDSPHYGERWGRHWLDLVRYAETDGHEFDNDKPNIWRYRDYVIRAFNQDLPYDQFVMEHIAGDQIENPRIDPKTGFAESPIGTGFFWLCDVVNSPVDSFKAHSDRLENQVDVFGKAFLGLTLACARCHDHKFDPVSEDDYYALAGIFESSRVRSTAIDSPEKADNNRKIIEQIKPIDRAIADLVTKETLSRTQDFLLAAREVVMIHGSAGASPSLDLSSLTEQTAEAYGLEADALAGWLKALEQAKGNISSPLYAWTRLNERSVPFAQTLTQVFDELNQARSNTLSDDHELLYEDFLQLSEGKWIATGQAFEEAIGWNPVNPFELVKGDLLIKQPGKGYLNSGKISKRFKGAMISPIFLTKKRYVHVRMAGNGSVDVVSDEYHARNKSSESSEEFKWYTHDLLMYVNKRNYIEITDDDPDGFVVVDQILFSDDKAPPNDEIIEEHTLPNSKITALLDANQESNVIELAEAYQHLLSEEMYRWVYDAEAGQNQPTIADWLLSNESPIKDWKDIRNNLEGLDQKRLDVLTQLRRELEEGIENTVFAMTMTDDDPRDMPLHIRGNHKSLGEPVPRGFLTVFEGETQPAIQNGSGRLQLGTRMLESAEPLVARVMVNRIWFHHFGNGLVRTLDNFGINGQKPTHPELLDYLATEFIKSGWSVKAMHRIMLLSSAYKTSNLANDKAISSDPENRLVHHIPVRRLEAESIRDAMLLVAGELDRKLFGPPILPYLTPFMDGRGRPSKSGPLDGDGRRSIYLNIRRNFMVPMFTAFDYPPPISTIGKRGTSTVPAQALTMLNNEFVYQQAELWAKKILRDQNTSTNDRIRSMYLSAFAREPKVEEQELIETFLNQQEEFYGGDKLAVWRDLCHSLFNVTEFIFLN